MIGSPFRGRVCLVTGSTGFIGSTLVQSLRKQGADVRATGGRSSKSAGDITIEGNVKRIFHNTRFDFVLHLAGKTNMRESWEKPREYFDTNVGGTQYLLETLRSCPDAQKVPFVYASSSSVYGVTETTIIEEGLPLNPVSPYAVTKSCAETLCRGYHSAFGLQTMVARPFYVTGYGCNRGVVFEIARKMARIEVTSGKVGTITVENVDVVLDVIDVHDCVAGLETIAAKGEAGEAYNISTGTGRSIREISDVLLSKSDVSVQVKETAGGERPRDTPRLVGNPSKLERLGWKPRRSFEETINDVLDCCRESVKSKSQIDADR